jgi:hypothetical protein
VGETGDRDSFFYCLCFCYNKSARFNKNGSLSPVSLRSALDIFSAFAYSKKAEKEEKQIKEEQNEKKHKKADKTSGMFDHNRMNIDMHGNQLQKHNGLPRTERRNQSERTSKPPKKYASRRGGRKHIDPKRKKLGAKSIDRRSGPF